jgi:Domain of unknown function (DUF3825)
MTSLLPDNTTYIYSLYKFALIPQMTEQLEDLAQMAEHEDWSYQYTYSEFKKPILFYYIHYSFMRIQEENKIEETNDKRFCCFNTGLVTEFQEPIYMVFEQNFLKDNPSPWHFKKFSKKGDYELTKFTVLPQMANYFEDPSLLVFDTRLELRANYEHIISENRERFPKKYKKMAIYGLQNLVKGAIESAKERVTRNYKVAIPQYYRNKVQLLLPLCLEDPRKADLALVVARYDREGDEIKSFYRASTCLTLDMAYSNARLLARPDRDWLQP